MKWREQLERTELRLLDRSDGPKDKTAESEVGMYRTRMVSFGNIVWKSALLA